MSDFTNSAILGLLLTKIEFWTHRYEFSFQFWGAGQNNVFIVKDDVEIATFGSEGSIKEILERTIEWCEKANPRIKYSMKTTDAPSVYSRDECVFHYCPSPETCKEKNACCNG